MSWLADIAGRAEDLLNRVDKSAAGALQKPRNYIPSEETTTDILYVEKETSTKKFPATTTSSSSSQISVKSNFTASPSTPRVNNTPKTDQDDKLFEFLNSPETSKPVKKSPPAKKENTEGKRSIEHEKEHNAQHVSSSTSDENIHLRAIPPDTRLNAVDTTELCRDEHIVEVLQESVPSETTASVTAEIDPNTDDNNHPTEYIQKLEAENRLLRSEVVSLTSELNDINHRRQESEGEIRRLQKKSEHWNSQVSTSDHLIRELQEKESDLLTALDAKDSQLAVLRVRIQETDQELMVHRTLVETLRSENEKLVKELSDTSGLHHQALENLQEKLQETELAFRHEQEARKLAEVESLHRFSKLEEEQKSLTETLTSVQKKYMEEKALNKDQASQLKNVQVALDLAKQDLAEYRQKAQRILQSKEKLIATLKESREDSAEVGAVTMEAVEIEDLKQERDSLKEELQRTKAALAILRVDLQDAEQGNQQEMENIHQQTASLEKQLQHALQRNEELEADFNQQKEELRYVREDLTKTKTNLQIRIKDRDAELEKLRKQLTAKQSISSSQSELESRIRALTENLIQKQTLVEALSTEKNSLVMQLERMEQKIKDSQVLNSRSPIHVGITVADDDSKNRLPVLMTESPYDNTVTRRVKRAYSIVDTFSVRLGVFLRHYPIARTFVIFYMILLHLWVMVVLLTYQPEVHGAQKLEKTGPK